MRSSALGLKTGDGVAAILPNSRHYFELRLATGRSGLYFIPISHHLTAAEIAYIVEDCEARVVVVDESLLGAAERALDEVGFRADGRIVVGAAAGWIGYEDFLREQPTTPPDGPRAGSIMMYTSGTTGRPKGVRRQLPEGPPQVTETELNLTRPLGIFPGHEVQLAAAPLYHGAPGVFANAGLNFGHTIVIAQRPTPEEWLRLIDRHKVSITFTVPTVLHRLLRLPEEVRGRYDTSSLRSLVHGAAPCPAEVKRAAIDWLGPVVHEFYAATEGPATTATAREWLARPGTVGRPLRGIEVRVVDAAGNTLPAGETGTVYYSPSYRIRVLQGHREDGRLDEGRPVHGRRHRLSRRGRVAVPLRPPHGPHPLRRSQRLSGGGGGRSPRPPGRGRRRRDRCAGRGVGPAGDRRRTAGSRCAGRGRTGRAAHRALPHPTGRIQDPPLHDLHRPPARTAMGKVRRHELRTAATPHDE